MDLGLFIVFIIGFCLGGLVGIDSPRQNTNAPPPTQPKRQRLSRCNEIRNRQGTTKELFEEGK